MRVAFSISCIILSMKCDLLSLDIVEGKIHSTKTLATDVAEVLWQGTASNYLENMQIRVVYMGSLVLFVI